MEHTKMTFGKDNYDLRVGGESILNLGDVNPIGLEPWGNPYIRNIDTTFNPKP